jgi:NAD(P)H-nitrite reductase large subunit
MANIYAAGDVAEALDAETNDYRLTPIWPSAYRQGKIAGMNMAGKREAYQGGPVFNSIPLLGLNIATAGLNKVEENEFEIVEKHSSGVYKRIALREDVIQGLVFIGDITRCGIYRFLIENRINVADFRERLLTDDFGIIDLPREYRHRDFVREVEQNASKY